MQPTRLADKCPKTKAKINRIVRWMAKGLGGAELRRKIAEKYGVLHVSTGDLFRDMDETTELGKKVRGFMKRGVLVPDGIVVEMVRERLSLEDCKDGFILDGFPRNVNQAQALDRITKITHVLLLNISDETAIERLESENGLKE